MKKNIVLAIAILALSFTSCKKKSSTPDEPTPTPVVPAPVVVDINSVPQTSFKMDGVSKSYVTNEDNILDGVGRAGDGSNTRYSTVIGDDTGDLEYMGFEKGIINTSSGDPSDAVFKAFFAVGSKPYSVNAVAGIEASIIDEAGVKWSTSLGSQAGSTFSIDDTKDVADLSGDFYLKVKISFSCKLYDASGHVKVITDGIYVGHFGNI